jgi:ABC-type tungstate transport system permease subunit
MKKRRLKGSAMVGAAVLAAGIGASVAEGYQIRILGTSDITDSNLFAAKMQTLYASSPYFVTGDTLKYTSSGSGQALTSAEQGFGDVVLTHAPLLEAPFVAGGFSLEGDGRALFYNDYVVAGPSGTTDPAGIVGSAAAHNAVLAFKQIAAAGATGSATFVSRNDASGTNVQEETMWGQANAAYGVTVQPAQNEQAGVTGLFQPAASTGSTVYPSWYVFESGSANQKQGQNLINTSKCGTVFTGRTGCYTLTDDGTFAFITTPSNDQAPGLQQVVATNTTGPGGVTELVNPFHAYIVNPTDPTTGSGGVYPFGATPNVTAATRFVNFLTGATGASGAGSTGLSGEVTYKPEFQDELNTYLSGSIFPNGPIREDAFPVLPPSSVTPALGQNVPVVHGTNITVKATLTYGPPPSPAIVSMPYSLQESTNGGAWTTLTTGGTGNSNASGVVTGTFQLAHMGDKAQIRLFTPRFDDSSIATFFSPDNDQKDFGTFTATS